MEEIKRGGKRSGAGRKPIDNPKKPITIYVEKTKIFSMGGEEKLKFKLNEFIVKETKVPENDFKTIVATLHQNDYDAPRLPENTQDEVKIWVEPKNNMKPPKTLADYVKAKRECELAEQYEALLAEVEADPYLTQKQKTAFKLA